VARYSEAFSQTKAAKKFARVHALVDAAPALARRVAVGRESSDPTVKSHADALALIMSTGIRPGSERDTGAARQAYGATTLRAEHVHQGGAGDVRLKFTGKKGVDLDLPVADRDIAKMLVRRAATGGQLFPEVNDKSLRDYTHSLDKRFSTKDFRTLLGTLVASHEVESGPMPTNMKEYKAAVLRVARKVSARLGNTPAVALESYISPQVWAKWRAGVEDE
jgi:DNA topoisomerase-1